MTNWNRLRIVNNVAHFIQKAKTPYFTCINGGDADDAASTYSIQD